jgi:uncharacterized membrane protein YhfC
VPPLGAMGIPCGVGHARFDVFLIDKASDSNILISSFTINFGNCQFEEVRCRLTEQDKRNPIAILFEITDPFCILI